MKLDISFVSSNKDPDNPIVIRREESRLDYDTDELGEEYYPSREQKFNVDLSNIQIGGNLIKNTKYELILEGQSEVIPMLSQIQAKDDNEILTEDDIRLNIDVEDSKNQTKSIKDRIKDLPVDEIKKLFNDFSNEKMGEFLDEDGETIDLDKEGFDD